MKEGFLNKKNLQTGFKIFITIGIFFWYLFNNYSLIYNFELKNFNYFIYAVGIKSLNIFVIAFINLFAFKTKNKNFIHTDAEIHTFSLLGNFLVLKNQVLHIKLLF